MSSRGGANLKIADKGLASQKNGRTLTFVLILGGTGILDLKPLKNMKGLTHLEIFGVKEGDPRIQQLETWLPNLEVLLRDYAH